jgi:hypothetical protein
VPASTIGHSSAASRRRRALPASAPVSIRSPSSADQTCASQKTMLVEISVSAIVSALVSWRSAATSPVARIEP